jgi:hydrogenase/urease accessory protein HupE
VECAGDSLIGKAFGVEGLAAAKTDALLRLELRDGSEIDTVLRSSRPSFTVPAHPEPLDVARRFATLGFDHIASGYDHLLFVLGLLLLVQGTRALIATISAFTLGHSVTLTLAVLGVTNVPSAPVEVLIAFSVFILATELARGRATRARGARWLCAMAALFGLLHGLGFAGMLSEVGLPSGAIPLALACFNLGIVLAL